VQARNAFGYALIDTNGKLLRPAADTDYRKPETQLLRELVIRANPDAASTLDSGQVVYETPTAIQYVRGDESNTTIVAKAAPNALDVVGRQTLRYRRIDLSKLFRYQTIELTRYSNSNTLPWAEVQELLLKQHGINISTDTFTAASLTANTVATFTAKATSLCYIGSIQVVWRKGRREISEMFTTATLDGRTWPEGLIQFGDNYKPQGEYIAYDFDFTDLMGSSFTSWGNGTITNSVSELDKLANALKLAAPQFNWNSGQASVENVGGTAGLMFNRYALPNAVAPEANGALYNRVAILTPVLGDTWFYGRLLFHYKV